MEKIGRGEVVSTLHTYIGLSLRMHFVGKAYA